MKFIYAKVSLPFLPMDNNNNYDNNNNFEYLNWIDTSTYEKLLSTCVQYKLKNVSLTLSCLTKAI